MDMDRKSYVYHLLWMGNNVNGKELAEHYYRPDSEGTRQANYNYAWYNNPYFAANELTQKHDRNTMNGQLKLNWDVIPGLSLQGRAAGRLESTFEDMSVPKSYMNYGDSRNGDYKRGILISWTSMRIFLLLTHVLSAGILR